MGFAGHQPSFRLTERHCLKEIRWRVAAVRLIPSGLRVCACLQAPMLTLHTYAAHSHTYTNKLKTKGWDRRI